MKQNKDGAEAYFQSPVGLLRIKAEMGAVTELDMAEKQDVEYAPGEWKILEGDREEHLLKQTIQQLQEYFAGQRRDFTIPIRTNGTPFREKVWEALRTIPYGETRSYGQIAAQVGKPKASRAVGGANHHNPVMILTPCHRVIGADGSLTGFGGGLDVKEKLLQLEKEGNFL